MLILLRLSIIVLTITLLAGACAPSAPLATPIAVQLSWTHSAQFAGMYAADRNGDYTSAGLAVTLIPGGPSVDAVSAVLDGKAQFGIVGGDVLISERAASKSVRAIATILRRDPYVFITLASSGITRPEDFAGKRVLVRPRARPRLYAVLNNVGLSPDRITEINQGDLSDLYSGAVDVASGFVTNEVLAAEQAGYKLNLIYPDDYGVHFYSDTLFSTDDYIDANPELVTRFLKATFDGWTNAVENPDTVGALVNSYDADTNSAFETTKMIASIPFINTAEDHIGWMKPDTWKAMELTLREPGGLTAPVDVSQVYTLKFLEAIYQGP